MQEYLDPPLLIAIVSTVAGGLVLTAPDECRSHRWTKIIISIPPAMVIAQAFVVIAWGYFAFFMFLFLALVWRGNIAWVFANVITTYITKHSDTIAPDFRRAKIEYRDGNLKQALALAEKELNKDFNDVEGLLFVAQLLAADGQFEKALAASVRAANCSSATPAQVFRAEASANEIKEVLNIRNEFAQKVS